MDGDVTGGGSTASVAALRAAFNDVAAPSIARQLDLPAPAVGAGYSKRFAFFADAHRLAVVAGAQEGDDVELALAHGVRHAKGRALTLVLPEGHTNATAQRAPWLRESARPTIFVHRDGAHIEQLIGLTQRGSIAALSEPRQGQSPTDELASATSPASLGKATDGVWGLVEWATTSPVLDAGHRSGERSWHYAGQRVLSISRIKRGVSIVAGIHYSGANKPAAVLLNDGESLSTDALMGLQSLVLDAIEQRKGTGPKAIHRPDEHWLQAILRRNPHVVGIEQPALRELPAWRPHDSTRRWGRGFVDLLGLDGHGAIRIIETKLATNSDDLLVLQGLDYFVWASAYLEVLRSRLGAAKSADLEIHYVLGANPIDGSIKLSPCTSALAAALDDTVPWRFQVVHDWFNPPNAAGAVGATTSPPKVVPSTSPSGVFNLHRVAAPESLSEVSGADAHTLFGEQAEWGFAIPWVYQALADPTGGRPMLRAPQRGDDSWPGALAYWGSLLHLLVYGFGWSRPDRGLRWWYDAGKPTHDLKLALLSEVWEADGQLDWFAAWVWTDGRRKYLPELEFVDGPQLVDRQWLCSVEDQIQKSGAPAPYGGGTDPLHLTGHIDGPTRDVPHGAVVSPGIAGGAAVLAARSMEGWYRELLHRRDLHDLDCDSSGVEVIVEPVGSLGVFRRSPVTALWFSCSHGVHLVGN